MERLSSAFTGAEKKSIYSPISIKDREKSNAMCGLYFMSFFKAEIVC